MRIETITKPDTGSKTRYLAHIYIYTYILKEKEEIEQQLEKGKNDRRNPAGNSNPGPLAFRAIALPVKLLGQVRLRPNHGTTLSLSSRYNAK